MNIFELHNQNNYFYQKPENRLSLRLMKELVAGYHVRAYDLYEDVFGVLDNKKFFEFPTYDGSDLIDACFDRAKELPNINFLWSGGVDSTFILACYKLSGVPIKVWHYNHEKNYVSSKLRKYIRNNFEYHEINEESEIFKVNPVYLASLADCFFYSSQRLIGTRQSILVNERGRINEKLIYFDQPFMSLEDRMYNAFNNSTRTFTDSEIMLVSQYAKAFDKPMNTNNRIARFLCFTCSLPKQAFIWSGPFYLGMNSFFLTQKFINIAYSQYWDSNETPWLHDKKTFKSIIAKAFGSDFGIESNIF